MSKTETKSKPKPAAKAKSDAKPQAKSFDRNAPSLTPHIVCRDAAKAIDFYKKAFGAVELMRLPGPNGKLMHARAADQRLHADAQRRDARAQRAVPAVAEGHAVTLHLNVPDVDAAFARAVKAGATVTDARRRHVLGRPLRHRHRSLRTLLVDRHAQART